MKDEEVLKPTIILPSSDVSENSPSAYDLLVRQSKKLGIVATKAFHELKDRLHQEMSLAPALPSKEQFLDNISQIVKSKQSELEKAVQLRKAVKRSHEIIANVRTVFPVTLFPDSLIIDRTKVSIIYRDFFWTSNVISFQIEDILNVSCSVGPLFGSLTIASRVMSTVDHFHINYLWRSDAIVMQHIIQGYVIAKNNKLDTDQLTRNELLDTLSELGTDSDRR